MNKIPWPEKGTTENESNDGARNRRKMVSCSNRGSLRWERCLAPGPRLIPRERAQLEDVQKETESIRKINIRRWQRRCRYSPGSKQSLLPTDGRGVNAAKKNAVILLVSSCFRFWKMNANFSEFLNCCCRFPASGPPLFLWSLIWTTSRSKYKGIFSSI